MIDPRGNGRLIDFDLARETGAQRSLRTVNLPLLPLMDKLLTMIFQGTWQFLSTRQLIHPGATYGVSDELESFFFIILYEGLHRVTHNKPQRLDMPYIFDHVHTMPDGSQIGGVGKVNMYQARSDMILEELNFTNSPPFTNLIRELFRLFRSLGFVNAGCTSAEDNQNVSKLKDCKGIVRLMKNAVERTGWPEESDKATSDNYPRKEEM